MARDHLGQVLEARARCSVGLPDPEVAEILGIKEVLSWIKSRGLSGVEVESDCWIAIQAIRSSSKLLSYFGRLVFDCRKLLSELHSCNVCLCFVKRSANTVAHSVAKATSSIADRMWSGVDFPAEFAYVVSKDLI